MSRFNSDENKDRLPSWVSAKDVARRNNENRVLFSTKEHTEADSFYDMAQVAYKCSRVFKNYRANSITIKVESPKMGDKVSNDVWLLNTYAKVSGIKTKLTATSIIYHMPRIK